MDTSEILYHHERLNAYECLGCHEMLEVPATAVLRNGQRPERVRDNPENLLRWVELHAKDHKDCAKFKDADKAEQHRAYRGGSLHSITDGIRARVQ